MDRGRDQELRDARDRYIRAVREFDRALIAFDHSGMAMDPGPGAEPIPWTRVHVDTIKRLSATVQAAIDARRDWDMLRRRTVTADR